MTGDEVKALPALLTAAERGIRVEEALAKLARQELCREMDDCQLWAEDFQRLYDAAIEIARVALTPQPEE